MARRCTSTARSDSGAFKELSPSRDPENVVAISAIRLSPSTAGGAAGFIPDPSSVALLGMGPTGLMACGWRRWKLTAENYPTTGARAAEAQTFFLSGPVFHRQAGNSTEVLQVAAQQR